MDCKPIKPIYHQIAFKQLLVAPIYNLLPSNRTSTKLLLNW